ncbi:Hpt domain-containing protein [Mucilaginibacter ginkgonis]|uniref:Hpt domain-containing protein n=1 Tax=Mucilaginibacter ginkgonis TaxID=2682091 RepID=A0A6I4I705_9SPHI|nr:Hpt domain-containing protein [Mucilaginibacter ginkgonis]QQL50716.1 Hpt domain-containing protein [Mucilaginibacter ginkgonis]
MSGNQDLDLTFLYEIADGSNEFIVESIDMFLQQSPQMLNEIDFAISVQDWAIVGATAHKIKPNLGFFGMTASQAAMQEVEHMGKSGMPDVALLTSKFNAVKSVIEGNLTELARIKAEAEANL